MTVATPLARITSPMPTGRLWLWPPVIQPRRAGTSDKANTLTRAPPTAGSATGSVVNCQSAGVGRPTGRCLVLEP